MQGLILAAGMGRRLKELTQNNTKCMVKVDGVSLIDRLLHQLEKYNLSRIIIVVGYEGAKLIDYIGTLGIKTPIYYVNNPIYDKTNNIYSLALAKKHLCEDDTLLFESDLIFEDSIIDAVINDERHTLAVVDKYESWMDGTCVRLTDDDCIAEFVPGKAFDFNNTKDYYKTVNIYKFSKEFSKSCYVPFLEAYCSALGNNEYYEQVLRVIAILDDTELRALRLNGEFWYEIDDAQDLDIANSIFASNDERKTQLLQSRYGGYWRYPQLLDFCYLVNPYYPPKKMVDEIKASFEKLLTQYPSGMRVNALIAAKDFNVHPENLVVGNGAAELIKALMEDFTGKTGFVRPTFEEYPNRYDNDNSVLFTPDTDDFSYNAKDLMGFYADGKVNNLVIINPDNPSGNYITKSEMLELISWTADNNIKLVVDESFIDFAEEDGSLIEQKLLNDNPHVYIIKSISKSYGVPGLRLGVLVTGDKETVARIKKSVSIWNINSFAEFYLQIAEKYKNDYAVGLERFKNERTRFAEELSNIEGLRVIPSQANYFMIGLTGGISSTELTKRLLVKHNIFIKDLSSKIKIKNNSFIRVAIRNTEDNDKFICALKQELCQIANE